MHPIDNPATPEETPGTSGPWHRELTRYHWFVLIVAALGWLFDTMDQQLFTLARVPALRDLLAGQSASVDAETLNRVIIPAYSGYATAIFLLGWASGGLIFGMLGDRYGRARVMAWTILMYSACTGLSALSVGFWDFAAYRFLTGLGVGGEFAVGVALVAEVMPPRARPFALGLLQALSAVGNIAAALISIGFGHLEQTGAVGDAWRWMFVVGAVPALLVVVIRRRLKEPERWQRAVAAPTTDDSFAVLPEPQPRYRPGSYLELFGTPLLRKHAIIGLLLAFSGVVGVWGIGFFTVDLFDSVLTKSFASQGLDPEVASGRVAVWKGILSMMLNLGAFFGIYCFAYLSHWMGRRPAFAISLISAAASTALVFAYLDGFSDVFWMVPLMGFCLLSLFGGYAIYFPELFPTRLRSTGTSFCYNVGRFVAAAGPFTLGLLTSQVFAGTDEPMRYAGISMCAVFVVGLAVLPFAPETRGRPLPD